MFYFDDFYGKKVLKSDFLEGIYHFFTTRDFDDFEKLDCKRLITPAQTHSNNVEIVDERTEYPDTDGLIFNEKGDCVYLRFADCTPLIFYDSKNKAIAISHAGWRGTAGSIGVCTIEKMMAFYGTKPSDIVALIGPAISKCCYEVSEDVKNKLLATVKDTTNLYNGNYVDLKNINARQLQEIGVTKIDICPYCTSCNNDKFHSYRKENGTLKRHYAIAKL